MSSSPEDRYYAITHEWAKLESETLVSVGITDFAQSELGDLVYIQLPEVGKQLGLEEQCVTIESVKTASDLFSPAAGEVVEINEALADEPELINEAAFDTWLFKLKIKNASDLENLIDAAAYDEAVL